MKPRRLALSLLALYLSFLPWVLVPTRPVEIRREKVIEPHYQILNRNPNRMSDKAMTQHFQCLLLSLEHRIRDLRDWCDRHDLPYRTQISALLHEESSPHGLLEILSHFDSYKEAHRWAWLHCKCTDSQHGVDACRLSEFSGSGYPKSYIWIQMPDFRITLIFPSSTHPDLNLIPA